jgi:hypothetical protein
MSRTIDSAELWHYSIRTMMTSGCRARLLLPPPSTCESASVATVWLIHLFSQPIFGSEHFLLA